MMQASPIRVLLGLGLLVGRLSLIETVAAMGAIGAVRERRRIGHRNLFEELLLAMSCKYVHRPTLASARHKLGHSQLQTGQSGRNRQCPACCIMVGADRTPSDYI